MRLRILLLLLIVFDGEMQSQFNTDFTQLKLNVSPRPEQGLIEGEVTLEYAADTAVDSIFLNGIRMEYQDVKLNGQAVGYDYNDEGIWLKPTTALDTNEIFIRYRCKPRKGIYFIGWNDPSGRARKQIWTQGQGIDHRHWIPHRDEQTDKLLIELAIKFDENYQVMANGRLVRTEKIGNGELLWHYRMQKPMSSYLIALVIGKYDSVNTQGDNGVPLSQYFYPDRRNDYQYYYYQNEEIFNFLNSEIGVKFPWQNYKQAPVRDFRHGAMENTSATIFGDFFLVDEIAFNDGNYSYVNAHELAHQWFGNLVTATGSDEHWLHEGFATYYQWRSEKHLYGEDYYDWERYKAARMIFEQSRIDTIPLGNGKAGSTRFYQKGAWLLYMMEQMLGQEKFDTAMAHYLRQNAFGVVTTDSLNAAILATTGLDYNGWFEYWLHTAGEPVANIRTHYEDDHFTYISEPEFMPDGWESITIPIEMHYRDSTSAIVYHHIRPVADSLRQLMYRPTGDPHIEYWISNPGMQMLVDIREQKPLEIWVKQYRYANNVIDRYRAVEAMAGFEFALVEKLLVSIAENEEEFYAIRAEAFRQLAAAEYPYLNSLLQAGLSGDDVQLQKEIVVLLDGRQESMGHLLAGLRRGKSYQLRQNAIHLSIDLEKKNNNRWLYDDIYEEQPGIPGQQVLITALSYRALIFKDKEALEELADFTSLSFDFMTRINAMQALSSLEYYDRQVMANLLDALTDPNWKLRSMAKSLLSRWYGQSYGKKYILQAIDDKRAGWDDFDKRIVNRTFGLKLN